ncbi:N-acetylmuramoyl-L-alanine amidase sle1 [Microbacterium lemovicicum]|uniref:N-acetylmuramoyl-L-alanine amidase sle1 n=1 Tax=Microbacterium lemovicicum TaxID=1072463 RepID=A0A3S9W968_9MICO|nr:LysM peptidoglycan-binding domain-containing protein [Microbacterium lemovicicum]AZS36554.1 N-acetylmuramoyl-L-alanine amidase sle1 [Microbacterium lemovicicum]
MRQPIGPEPIQTVHPAPRRLPTSGLPAVVAGSIAGSLALTLAAVPAHAADAPRNSELRMPRLSGEPAAATFRASAVQAALMGVEAGDYVVQPGDTISAIAARFGVKIADVFALNGLGWSSVIHPGQHLRVTGSAPAPTAAPAPAAPAPAPASAGAVTVAVGDTISAIARRAGVSTQAVLDANGLGWSSVIMPGQKLALPGSAPVTAAAPAPAAPVAAPAPAPAPAAAGYTIVAGDTISGIAQRHGVSIRALLEANGLGADSIIYPGQSLAIPDAATVAALAAVPAASSTPLDLDEEQAANARTIIGIGRQLGVSDRGIAIALGTAMQESWLRNLDWGDRDSLGLFQQRPSTGWGTAAEVTDPGYATRVFFGGASDPNGYDTRGLLDIAGWESMSFADAAQAVQISAYPDRYAQWEQPATTWLSVLG